MVAGWLVDCWLVGLVSVPSCPVDRFLFLGKSSLDQPKSSAFPHRAGGVWAKRAFFRGFLASSL